MGVVPGHLRRGVLGDNPRLSGGREAPVALGVARERVGGEYVWFSPAVAAVGVERHGQSTGRAGLVPARLWLLRACCCARGGVARVSDALREGLYREEELWDPRYARTADGVLIRELRPCPPFPAPAPSETLWLQLCALFGAEWRTRASVGRLARALWDAQQSVGMSWTGTTFAITGQVNHCWLALARSHLSPGTGRGDADRPPRVPRDAGASAERFGGGRGAAERSTDRLAAPRPQGA